MVPQLTFADGRNNARLGVYLDKYLTALALNLFVTQVQHHLIFTTLFSFSIHPNTNSVSNLLLLPY